MAHVWSLDEDGLSLRGWIGGQLVVKESGHSLLGFVALGDEAPLVLREGDGRLGLCHWQSGGGHNGDREDGRSGDRAEEDEDWNGAKGGEEGLGLLSRAVLWKVVDSGGEVLGVVELLWGAARQEREEGGRGEGSMLPAMYHTREQLCAVLRLLREEVYRSMEREREEVIRRETLWRALLTMLRCLLGSRGESGQPICKYDAEIGGVGSNCCCSSCCLYEVEMLETVGLIRQCFRGTCVKEAGVCTCSCTSTLPTLPAAQLLKGETGKGAGSVLLVVVAERNGEEGSGPEGRQHQEAWMLLRVKVGSAHVHIVVCLALDER